MNLNKSIPGHFPQQQVSTTSAQGRSYIKSANRPELTVFLLRLP
jgi:hypothetical protein